MEAFTRLKIIIAERATGNVLQSLLKPNREGEAAARCRYSPAELGPMGKSCGARGAAPSPPERGRGRYSRAGGLSVPALIGLFFQGAVGILVFQWLQTSSPKYRPPPLAWFAAL